MGLFGARLFTWVQAAPAYRDLHAKAVDLLGSGDGRTWVDVGSGPGLVAELAAARGFTATALDTDPRMVRAASRRANRGTHFDARLADAADSTGSYDVVSAASLLCQVEDPSAVLQTLWAGVRPGGALLIVETTDRMSVDAVRNACATDAHSRMVMNRWAAARHGRALPDSLFAQVPADSSTRVAFLDGCVAAHLFRCQAAKG